MLVTGSRSIKSAGIVVEVQISMFATVRVLPLMTEAEGDVPQLGSRPQRLPT